MVILFFALFLLMFMIPVLDLKENNIEYTNRNTIKIIDDNKKNLTKVILKFWLGFIIIIFLLLYLRIILLVAFHQLNQVLLSMDKRHLSP